MLNDLMPGMPGVREVQTYFEPSCLSNVLFWTIFLYIFKKKKRKSVHINLGNSVKDIHIIFMQPSAGVADINE